MSGITIYKDGATKIVDSKRLQRFLDGGWSHDPQPKWSASVEATADIIKPEAEVEAEVYNEESEEYAEEDYEIDLDADTEDTANNQGDN
tara:strand:+ start:1068 stop:1334 length:267 start_codon:yes stop_codon:yes gene_type:complete